ncbi:flavodoxin family protein [Pontiella sp.]|uniref:flavodoxin family protein n=1 Tax=Pontiella sp. TaxID=2837462 RepID=UPI0035643822
MKVLVAYSSATGNTRKVAEAIHLALPDADLCPVGHAPNPEGYDLVFLGCWIDKGLADEAARAYMSKLHGKPVALFATLGAYPDSKYAADCMDAVSELLSACTVVDRFVCQGAIDPKLVEWMKGLPKDHGYGPTTSRKKLWRDAESHPDDADLEAAADWAEGVLAAL